MCMCHATHHECHLIERCVTVPEVDNVGVGAGIKEQLDGVHLN